LFDIGDDNPVSHVHPVLFGQVACQRLHGHSEIRSRAFACVTAFVDSRRVFVRPFLGDDLDLHVSDLPAGRARHVKRYRAADLFAAHLVLQILRGRDAHSIDGSDDVGWFEVRFRSGPVAQYFTNHDAVVYALKGVPEFREIGKGANSDAQPGAGHFAVRNQFPGNLFCQVAGNGETDAGAQTADQRVDADHLAVDVHQRSTAVARVDVGIRLDEILIHGRAFLSVDDVAALGADVPERNAIVEAERRSDGDGKFT